MKNIFRPLAFLPLLFIAFSASPQAMKGQSEISVGVGRLSSYYLFANAFPAENKHKPTNDIIQFTCKYYVTGKVAVGLSYAYESLSRHESYTSVSPEMTFSYMDKKIRNNDGAVKLYSTVAWGIVIGNNPNGMFGTQALPLGMHFTGVGLRVGGSIGGFAELGIGYKGLINFGVSARFSKRNKKQ